MFIRDHVPPPAGLLCNTLPLLPPHGGPGFCEAPTPIPKTRPLQPYWSVFPCRSTAKRLVEDRPQELDFLCTSDRDWESCSCLDAVLSQSSQQGPGQPGHQHRLPGREERWGERREDQARLSSLLACIQAVALREKRGMG